MMLFNILVHPLQAVTCGQVWNFHWWLLVSAWNVSDFGALLDLGILDPQIGLRMLKLFSIGIPCAQYK